jgi:MFS family permease
MSFKNFFSSYYGLPKSVFVLFIARIINCIGSFVYPFLTLFLTIKLGYSTEKAGYFVTGVVIAGSIGLLTGGKLADHFGRKKIFVVLSTISAIIFIICAILGKSPVVPWLIILSNLFLAGVLPSINAMITDLADPEKRKAAFSLIYLGTNLGVAIGPVIAGFLFNNYTKLIFLLDAASTLLSLIPVVIFVKETIPIKKEELSGYSINNSNSEITNSEITNSKITNDEIENSEIASYKNYKKTNEEKEANSINIEESVQENITTTTEITTTREIKEEIFAQKEKEKEKEIKIKIEKENLKEKELATKKETQSKSEITEKPESGNVIKVLFRRPWLVIFAFISLIYTFVYSQNYFSLPLYLNLHFGERGPKVYGTLMSTNAIVVILLTIFLINLMKNSKPIINIAFAGLLYAVGFGVIYLITNEFLLILSTIVWTLGEIIQTINTNVYVADNSPITHRARFSGIISFITDIGFITSPILMGYYIKHKTVTQVWPLIFGLAIFASICMFILYLSENIRKKRLNAKHLAKSS